MPIGRCKLTDCSKRDIEVCTAKEIVIDGVGQVQCYDPVPRSALVHAPVNPRCRKNGRKYKSDKQGVLK